MAKIGRPHIFTQEIQDEICRAISTSSLSIKNLCKANSHWPCVQAIHEHRVRDKTFGDAYARAKAQQVEVIVDELMEIADDVSQDTVKGDDDIVRYDKEHINRSRLRIDTRKWLAAKLVPRLYGDQAKNGQDETLTLMQRVIDKL